MAKGEKIGYARVSTEGQNLGRQIEALESAGVTKIFSDKQSGKNMARPQWEALMGYIREGDELVVKSLDRLSRNYDDIKRTIQDIKAKGVTVTFLDQPFLNFNTGTEAMDKMMFDMLISLLGFVADNERQKILERQAEGIKIAKKAGKYTGRKAEYTADSEDMGKRLVYQKIVEGLPAIKAKEQTVNGLAKELKVSRNTVYRIKKQIEAEG